MYYSEKSLGIFASVDCIAGLSFRYGDEIFALSLLSWSLSDPRVDTNVTVAKLLCVAATSPVKAMTVKLSERSWDICIHVNRPAFGGTVHHFYHEPHKMRQMPAVSGNESKLACAMAFTRHFRRCISQFRCSRLKSRSRIFIKCPSSSEMRQISRVFSSARFIHPFQSWRVSTVPVFTRDRSCLLDHGCFLTYSVD